MFPPNMIFPYAKRLTAIDWDKNGVFYNMSRKHFPNVEQIDYLCGSPGSCHVLFRFFCNKNGIPVQFIWAIPSKYHRFFNDVPKEYIVKLKQADIQFLNNAMTDEDFNLWNHYKIMKGRELL